MFIWQRGRLLQPTESALWRLIVIAAQGLVVKPYVACAFPKGLVIGTGSKSRTSFRHFDTRKRFEFVKSANSLIVMVNTYSHNPFNPFERRIKPAHRDDALSLSRRLAAVKHALETLPR
jgi:hypothetical protein